MPTHYDTLPDIAVGHHPLYGIVAANPKQLAPSEWMLRRLDFHPVPDQPTLFALADQQRDGHGRTLRAIATLRAAGYLVDVDAGFDPALAADADLHFTRDTRMGPDIAFVEHGRLGIIAATGPPVSEYEGRQRLEEHGWSLDSRLGVYTLPPATERSEALTKVAAATVTMSRSGLEVAVEPGLAHDVVARHRRERQATHHGEHRREPTSTGRVAITPRPGRATSTSKAPAPSPAAVQPVDPRMAFRRTR
ncbi:hypothetical protein ACFU5Z_16310 [Streptomyces sp. NPDC057521]|uniref:hypothetical protein n=1 Tax=Streptomyces sp. NPDC057521 TaxID=3346156 RepID=UPI0036CBF14F